MKKFIFGIIFLTFVTASFSQTYTISGYVEDASTGERLIGAIVFDEDNKSNSTMSNEFGYFSLQVKKKEVNLRVMYIGYENFSQKLTLRGDTMITIKLNLENQLREVVVTSQRQKVQSTQMSSIDVPVKLIQSLPVIFGEVDLMKSLQLLPGVQSGVEGSSGIYVRGGGPDQNLILLDGVPIYNANHLFGFFSVFNTEAIKDVTLIKGGFPAHYGGRLSSVIDIRMKDGNLKKYGGSVSVGIISSKFTLEGPIVKDKASFIISARRTYIDALAYPFIKIFGTQKTEQPDYKDETSFLPGYYFYDLNTKFNYKIDDKNRVFFSLYSGDDKVYINVNEHYENFPDSGERVVSDENDKFRLGWGNTIAALRWNHVFAKKLFMNATLTYSRFRFYTSMNMDYKENNETLEFFDVSYNSGINDWAGNIDFYYKPNNKHKIRFGFNGIYHTFLPGLVSLNMKVTDEGWEVDTSFGSSPLYAPEFATYFEDDFSLTNRLKINAGVRLSAFKVRDSLFVSPEPRLAMRFLVSPDFSIKASYAEMMQYLHFLTNNTIGLPVDLWLPATDLTVPENSWQTALGVSFLLKNKFSFSVEGFYKEMHNIIELKEGETIFSQPGEEGMGEIWEQKVEQGNGWAYGGEFFVRKETGKLQGWIAYTLSWSLRQFPNINFGKVFPYKYDRRHDISVVLNYKFNKKIDMGMTWVFGSGTPITIPLGEYYTISDSRPTSITYYPDKVIVSGHKYFEQRNNYRLPSYHRLDLSVNLHKEKKHGTRTWSFGVYNAYNHINPFYTEINYDFESDKSVLRVYSIFPIMPSISYKFVWK